MLYDFPLDLHFLKVSDGTFCVCVLISFSLVKPSTSGNAEVLLVGELSLSLGRGAFQ